MASGLKIIQRAEDVEQERFIPDRNLVLTPDGRVVEEEAGTGHLFAVKGRAIPLSLARRYGLVAELEATSTPAEVVPAMAATPEVETPSRRRRGRSTE